jgi:Rod binding domain-containing protein
MTSITIQATASPMATTAAAPARDGATSAAASKFEAMMIGQMLQPMFDTIAEDKTFGGGPAEGMLRPMLVTEYANLMEQKGGLGLDDAIGKALGQAPEHGR